MLVQSVKLNMIRKIIRKILRKQTLFVYLLFEKKSIKNIDDT